MKRLLKVVLCMAVFLVFSSFGYALTAPEIEWNRSFDTGIREKSRSVQQTSDNGYIMAGDIGSDFWLVKTDFNGTHEWNKTFGGFDLAYSVQQTSDNGYIAAGGGSDFWLIKTDENGTHEWNKTFGGSGMDTAKSVKQTSDGGYIMAGNTNSFGAGDKDVWLVKTDVNGNHIWNKTFGDTSADFANSAQQTTDNGYIIAGGTVSYGGFWLVKTDPNGTHEWNKTFMDSSIYEFASSVQQTSDNGYIVAGTRGASWSEYDFWLVKTDSNGTHEWNKTYGGSSADFAMSVQQTSDNGYIIAGMEANNNGFWLVKTDSNGTHEWNKTIRSGGPYVNWAHSVQQTSDGGYVVTGNASPTEIGYDFWLVKLEGDKTPPSIITNLGEISKATTWVYWNWTNPTNFDFNHTEIYLDGVWKINTSNNYYNGTGLIRNTTHTVSTRTVDMYGNINTTWVNDSATTEANTAPTITSFYPPSATININETSADQLFNITKEDLDNDSLSVQWYKNSTTLAGETNDSYTFVVDNWDSDGSYNITVIVSDNISTDLQIWTLNIEDIPDADRDNIPDWDDIDDDNDGINDTDDTLTGNISFVETKNLNSTLNITVGSTTNLSQAFNESLNVSFMDGNITLVEFEFNFTGNTLALQNITIEKQESNATAGSVVVSGINLQAGQTKTVYVDDLDGAINSVCIRDLEIALISEITVECTGLNETLVNCDSTIIEGYNCTDIGSRYKVTGVKHSGIMENQGKKPISFNISLPLGWNLISVPIMTEDTNMTELLLPIEGNYSTIFAYDNSKWSMYDPDNLANSNLNNINETMGFWIRMNNSDILTIKGLLPVTRDFNLKQGWNLIGYPSNNTQLINETFNVSFTSILAYENSNWKSYSPTKPSSLNTLINMTPGYGYWVQLDIDANWTFTNGTYN